MTIDARRLQDAPLGGVGRALARTLPGIAAHCDVTLLTDARRPPPTDLPSGVQHVALAAPRGLPETVWLHATAGPWARQHPALFHGTFNALPARLHGPGVVTIYDLSFELHPEDFGAAKRQLFRVQARTAARKAAAIITASRFSAEQIIEQYRIDPERVVVVPLSVDPIFAPRPRDDGSAGRLGISRPYVVAVGGAQRRGVDVALAAWRAVRAKGVDIDLVVTGEGALASEVGLHDIGRPDDATWAAVLAGAEALCYPTRYEGFGMPALEAIASGTVVVAAPVASVPEVLGDAGAWAASPTVHDVTERLHDVLTDGALAGELRARGLARAAAAPSWDDVALHHVRTYEACA